MNGEELIVTQIGLLLSQVRYSRIALENIERATTRYAGLAISVAGAPGQAALGAPPLIDGALKVYVVNINDLTEGGGGIGDMIAGALGGAGRFLGGLFGGFVGGTISGVAFPYMLWQLRQIAESIERILLRIGRSPTSSSEGGSDGEPAGPAGPSIMAQAGSLAETLRLVAEAFRAAAGTSTASAPAGGGGAAASSGTPATSSMLVYLDLVRGVSHVVNGLVLLVPLLMGALASFLIRLDDIKLAIVDMLQFALRNVLLLRAAVLALVLDTLSLAGRLAASIIGIVATAVDTVLESVMRVIVAALQTVLAALQIASTGIKNTIDALMLFLRDGVGALLIFLGDLRVFRLVVHLAEVLPYVLPAIARIVDHPLSATETSALASAAAIAPPSGPSGRGAAPVPIAAFPDLAATLMPPAAQSDLVARVDALGRTIRTEAGTSFGAVQGAFGTIGDRMRTTVGTLDRGLHQELEGRLGTARDHAVDLANSMRAAEEVSRTRPRTGLEAIATAYEGWLRGGGLTTLMGQLDEHFRATPVAAGTGSVAGSVVRDVAERAGTRAVVVEIGEVTIDLGEAQAEPAVTGTTPTSGFDPEAFEEWQRNQEERRGIVPVTGLVPV